MKDLVEAAIRESGRDGQTSTQPSDGEDIDDDVQQEVQEWCETFTSLEYEDRVANLVAVLWPDEFEEHGSWEGALDAGGRTHTAGRHRRLRDGPVGFLTALHEAGGGGGG